MPKQMFSASTRRRFWRPPTFGLRTLFIVFTLFAVMAGLYGRRAMLISRENAAARQVVRLGGSVTYAGRRSLQGETALTRLVSYLAFDRYDHVTSVVFRNVLVRDEEIEVLHSFRKVEDVTLGGTLVTDDCVDSIRRLKAKRPSLMTYDNN